MGCRVMSYIDDRIGFTGTKKGMTLAQKIALENMLLDMMEPEYEMWFHHGDCIGADAEACKIAHDLGYKICMHPPLIMTKRAFCLYDDIHPPKPYLERNQEIIGSVDRLIACPKGPEERRSGTWYTIRHSRNVVPCTIIPPNGDYYEYTACR
jgi:hypothetical protein